MYIDPTRGNDDDGRLNATNGDIVLCVYDVRDPRSVTYLTDRVASLQPYYHLACRLCLVWEVEIVELA